MQPLLSLVDCNNFYVSCERVFRPDLIGKPVIVLSNNDGCVVARSKEVKDLGIKMGVPLFQIQQLVNQHQIMRIPVQSDHPFQANAATHSVLNQPLIPVNAATLW